MKVRLSRLEPLDDHSIGVFKSFGMTRGSLFIDIYLIHETMPSIPKGYAAYEGQKKRPVAGPRPVNYDIRYHPPSAVRCAQGSGCELPLQVSDEMKVEHIVQEKAEGDDWYSAICIVAS
jgi:hypothetical protein